jgi:hypothetical protein
MFAHGRNTRSDDEPQKDFVSRELGAGAVVGTMAELEALTTSAIQLTHEDLNSHGLVLRDLTPSIRQLAVHDTFESLRSLNDHSKLWEKRLYATTLESCAQSVALPVVIRSGPQPPLDGRTLTPKHFYRLWQIYNLPATPFPVLAWEGSLQKLALLRNDVAHGNLPIDEIFSQPGRSLASIQGYMNDIGLFAINFTDAWEQYLTSHGYLASHTQTGSS